MSPARLDGERAKRWTETIKQTAREACLDLQRVFGCVLDSASAAWTSMLKTTCGFLMDSTAGIILAASAKRVSRPSRSNHVRKLSMVSNG